MKDFLVNLDMDPLDGTLPPDKWQETRADDQIDALVKVANLPVNKGRFPEIAYVSLGTGRHSNGVPIAVTRFSLTYGG